MTTEDTIKKAIPTTSGFRNFAFCILTFSFTARPPHKPPILPNLPAYKAPDIYTPVRHYICREPSTNQLLFMQNKPNFQKSQMNVNPYNTKNYENESKWTLGENKPNQTQSKLISNGARVCQLDEDQRKFITVSPYCSFLLFQLSQRRYKKSGRRDSNPRRPAWEADILPLNYARYPFIPKALQ